MQYYILKEACGTKETGPVYPQIQKWKSGYDEDKPNSYYSYYNAAKGGYFPGFHPDLNSLIMHANAKPTDIVSSIISLGFIISHKLKLLFEQFSFPPHRFFPTNILHKKITLDEFFFMHIVSDYTDFVDYPRSTFITSGFSNTDVEHIVLTSKLDYIVESKNLQDNSFVKKLPYRSIKAEKIYLNEKFNKDLDFFRINRFDTTFYISQALRNAIIKNGMTGFDIQPTNRVTPFAAIV